MKKSFITGFAILFPLIITYQIIAFFIRILTDPFNGFVEGLFHQLHLFEADQKAVIHLFSILSILLILFSLIFTIGMLTRWLTARSLINFLENLLQKIPLINKLYSSCKELIDALFSSKENAFKQVVLIPYPTVDQLGIGFVTSEFTNTLRPELGDEFISVLVPCTPNPTVGLLCSFPKKSVIQTTMTVDEALKYIMSCGLKNP